MIEIFSLGMEFWYLWPHDTKCVKTCPDCNGKKTMKFSSGGKAICAKCSGTGEEWIKQGDYYEILGPFVIDMMLEKLTPEGTKKEFFATKSMFGNRDTDLFRFHFGDYGTKCYPLKIDMKIYASREEAEAAQKELHEKQEGLVKVTK